MTGYEKMAVEAVRSARVLLELGDNRGAINRAYYAVFNAARAALNAIEPGLGDGKKHATTLSRFAQHLVRTGAVDARFGRILTREFDARIAADYEQEDIEPEIAATQVSSAEEFVAVICQFLKSRTP